MSIQNQPNLLDQLLMRLARCKIVFGSDVYLSYTHAYVWLANQLCHVFFGLFFGLLILLLSCGSRSAVLIGLCIYVVKELIDYLIAVRLSEGMFRVNKIEVAVDCIVDVLFVAGGAFVAISVEPSMVAPYCGGLDPSTEQLLALGSFIGVTAYFFAASMVFLGPKRAFDKSGMAWLARLSTFPKNFPGEEISVLKKEIPAFAQGNGRFRHLVITGPPESGRTTLAHSIGGDATATKRPVRLITGQRLMEKTRTGFERPSAPKQPHQVAEAELVIVDSLSVTSALGPHRAPVDLSATLDRLVDVGGATIFQVPLRERAEEGGEPRSLGVEARGLPQTVWVIDDEAAAGPFLTAIKDKFGETAGLVSLEARLKRRMRLEE